MDCGVAKGEPAFSAEKMSRSQKGKQLGMRKAMDTLVLSKKLYWKVWLIFSVALSSVAQQCDSIIHKKYIFSYSFPCDLSLNV